MGGLLGAGILWGAMVLETVILGSGKEQKTDTFCCIQGSWSQDRICDRLKAPRLAHFGEGDEAGRLALGSRSTLHIRVRLSLRRGTGHCNANQLSLPYYSRSEQMCLNIYLYRAWLCGFGPLAGWAERAAGALVARNKASDLVELSLGSSGSGTSKERGRHQAAE